MTLARRDLPAVREAQDLSAGTVPHLDASAVQRIIEAARFSVRTGERNALLIATIFGRGAQGLGGPACAPPGPHAGRRRLGRSGARAMAGSGARWR